MSGPAEALDGGYSVLHGHVDESGTPVGPFVEVRHYPASRQAAVGTAEQVGIGEADETKALAPQEGGGR